MEGFNVYNDINARTNGEIYLGIVGPVRTGKSTFIKRFMEMMVLPNIKMRMTAKLLWMRCRNRHPVRQS